MNHDIDENEKELGEMGLLDHLEDLRWCLARAMIALIVCFPIGLLFVDSFIDYNVKLSKVTHLTAYEPTEIFLQKFRIAFMLSLFVSLPYILFQLWRFIAPALYDKEKRWGGFGTLASYILFLGGCLFGLMVITPMALDFFHGEQTATLHYVPKFKDVITFTFRISLAMGIVSQLPVVVILLFSLGLVSLEKLRDVRSYVYVSLFVLAAIVTPPDVISQLLLATPTIIFYESSILFCAFISSDSKAVSKATLVKGLLGIAVFLGAGGAGIWRISYLNAQEKNAAYEQLDKAFIEKSLSSTEGQLVLAKSIDDLEARSLELDKASRELLLLSWKEKELSAALQRSLLNYALRPTWESQAMDIELHVTPRFAVPVNFECLWSVQIDDKPAVFLSGANAIYHYRYQEGVVPDALTRRSVLASSANLRRDWHGDAKVRFTLHLLKVTNLKGQEISGLRELQSQPVLKVKLEK